MNIINVNDYDSMQAITISLAKNGYFVTSENVTDANYRSYWEIKYCEFSEVEEKLINNDNNLNRDQFSMEIHNKDNTKSVKCKILPDEKPLVENERDILDPNPYELVPRHNPDIPPINHQDVSDNKTEEQKNALVNNDGDGYIND